MGRPRVQSSCDGCHLLFNSRGLIKFKGKRLCKSCRNKLEGARLLQMIPHISTNEEILNKTYEIKLMGKTNPTGVCHFNRKLIGKKFKLLLVEENAR